MHYLFIYKWFDECLQGNLIDRIGYPSALVDLRNHGLQDWLINFGILVQYVSQLEITYSEVFLQKSVGKHPSNRPIPHPLQYKWMEQSEWEQQLLELVRLVALRDFLIIYVHQIA